MTGLASRQVPPVRAGAPPSTVFRAQYQFMAKVVCVERKRVTMIRRGGRCRLYRWYVTLIIEGHSAKLAVPAHVGLAVWVRLGRDRRCVTGGDRVGAASPRGARLS